MSAELEYWKQTAAHRGKSIPETTAARDVLSERKRQIESEGWTPEHDDEHTDGEMIRAAISYAINASGWNYGDAGSVRPVYWPWDEKWWKPSDTRRDLVKAAALLIAEIERIDRCGSDG